MIKNYLVGSDIEIFLFNKEEDRVVSAIGKIGGSKEEPRKIISEGFALQEDNVLIEFNVPPVSKGKDMHLNVMRVLSFLDENLPSDYGYVIKASHVMDDDQVSCPEANTIGCEQDNSAYRRGGKNPMPSFHELKNPNMRCAGGHIHLGYNNSSIEANCRIIRLMDMYIGIPSLLIDKDRDRRRLYGQAGNFRGKPYGVEYRSLSNFWAGNESVTLWMFDQIEKVVSDFNQGKDVPDELFDVIPNVINKGDESIAKKIIDYLKIEEYA